MFPDAEKFAEEWRAHCKSIGIATFPADGWLKAFNTMEIKSSNDPAAAKHFDEQLEIIRMDLPFMERLKLLIANKFEAPKPPPVRKTDA
jgi:hypothetical protein